MSHPLKPFTALYLPKAIAPSKPIRVGRDKSQARISIAEAKELQIQLAGAIRAAESNAHVTPKGLVLEDHKMNGYPYVTCPDQ